MATTATLNGGGHLSTQKEAVGKPPLDGDKMAVEVGVADEHRDPKRQKVSDEPAPNGTSDAAKPAAIGETTNTGAAATPAAVDVAALNQQLASARAELERLDSWHLAAQQELQFLKQLAAGSGDAVTDATNNQKNANVDNADATSSYLQYPHTFTPPLESALAEPQPPAMDAKKPPVSRIEAITASAVSVFDGEHYPNVLAELEERRQKVDERIRQYQQTAGRRLERAPEPPRNRTHYDYVLAEMQWMANDFRCERKLKLSVAKYVAYEVQKWHQQKNTQQWQDIAADRAALSTERTERQARISEYWSDMTKIVYHNNQQRLPAVEAKKREIQAKIESELASMSLSEIDALNKPADDGKAAATASPDAPSDDKPAEPATATTSSSDQEVIVVKQENASTTAVSTATPATTSDTGGAAAAPEAPRAKRKAVKLSVGPLGYRYEAVEEDNEISVKQEDASGNTVTIMQPNPSQYIPAEHRLNMNLRQKQYLYRAWAATLKQQGYQVLFDIVPAPLAPPYEDLIYPRQDTLQIDPTADHRFRGTLSMFIHPADVARMMGPLSTYSLDRYNKPTNVLLKLAEAAASGVVKTSRDAGGSSSIIKISVTRIANYRKRGFIPVIPRKKQPSAVLTVAMKEQIALAGQQATQVALQAGATVQAAAEAATTAIKQATTQHQLALAAAAGNKPKAFGCADRERLRQSLAKNSTVVIAPQQQRDAMRERVALLWTSGEDNLLLSLIGAYSTNWMIVSFALANITRVSGRLRSPRDCYSRYQLLIGQKDPKAYITPYSQISALPVPLPPLPSNATPQQQAQYAAALQNQQQQAAANNAAAAGRKKGQREQRNSVILPKKDGLRDKKRGSIGGYDSYQASPGGSTQGSAATPREPLGFGGGIFPLIDAAMYRVKRDRAYMQHNLKVQLPPVGPHEDMQGKVISVQHTSHKSALVEAHSRLALPPQAVGKTLMPHQIIQLRQRRQQQLAAIAQAQQAAAQAQHQAALAARAAQMPQDAKNAQQAPMQQQQQAPPAQNNMQLPQQPPVPQQPQPANGALPPQHQQQQQQLANGKPAQPPLPTQLLPQQSTGAQQPRYPQNGNAPPQLPMQQQQLGQRPTSAAGQHRVMPLPGQQQPPMPHNASPTSQQRTTSGGSQQYNVNARATPSPTPAPYNQQQPGYPNYQQPQQQQQYQASSRAQQPPPTNGVQPQYAGGRAGSPVRMSSRASSAQGQQQLPPNSGSPNQPAAAALYNQASYPTGYQQPPNNTNGSAAPPYGQANNAAYSNQLPQQPTYHQRQSSSQSYTSQPGGALPPQQQQPPGYGRQPSNQQVSPPQQYNQQYQQRTAPPQQQQQYQQPQQGYHQSRGSYDQSQNNYADGQNHTQQQPMMQNNQASSQYLKTMLTQMPQLRNEVDNVLKRNDYSSAQKQDYIVSAYRQQPTSQQPNGNVNAYTQFVSQLAQQPTHAPPSQSQINATLAHQSAQLLGYKGI